MDSISHTRYPSTTLDTDPLHTPPPFFLLITQQLNTPSATAGHNFAAYEASISVPALVGSAHGRILELGPGTGNQVGRFDASRVERIYGVEPNEAFAGPLAARVKDTPALLGKYTAVFAGVEDAARLAEHGIVEGSIDCVVSMQVLCSVRDPPAVARALYGLLRPGGELIFWEHGRGGDRLTRAVMCKSFF